MFCEKCGTEIPKGMKFCEKCGASVEPKLQKHKEEVSHKNWILGGIIGSIFIVSVVVVALFATGILGGKDETIQTSAGGGTQSDTGVSDVTEQPNMTSSPIPEPTQDTIVLSNEIEIDISAKSAVLIDNNSGQIIYEKNKDKKVIPASITKIMTLLLIFDALKQEKIKLADEVSVSEYAASMGGSQVFLEPEETQTVDTMIKCISIASANDAAVAMAEYIAGSESAFVEQMNQKAVELGMAHTYFKNCSGLDDNIESGHYSSAYDVALMSRALITEYPDISNYSTVWMDTIAHNTSGGQSEFGLTNTNKLIRTYQGITGLKTGSTSKAKYCISATAERNGVNLTAVIMGAPDPKTRFTEAQNLLDAGFANIVSNK